MLKQKPVWLIILALFSATSLNAHFLWKVNSEKPSYLYGTVHSSHPAVRDLPQEVVDALTTSTSFHPELEFSPENIGRIAATIFAPGTADLEKELPPQLWERLLKNTREVGIPEGLLRRIPVQLVPLLFASPPNTDFNKILDVQVYQLATENGIAVQQLETVNEQMEIFRNLGRKEAIVFLEEALKEWEGGFPTQAKILRLYSAGDLVGLKRFLDQEFARMDIPGLEDKLIHLRNQRMAQRLLPYLKEGGAFVAIGAGHMPGEKGIIALLEERGYTITRLPLAVKRNP